MSSKRNCVIWGSVCDNNDNKENNFEIDLKKMKELGHLCINIQFWT